MIQATLLYSHDVLSSNRKMPYIESGPRALTLSRFLSPFCKYLASLALCSGFIFAVVPSLDAQRVNEFSNWLSLLIKVLQLADRPVSVSFSQ